MIFYPENRTCRPYSILGDEDVKLHVSGKCTGEMPRTGIAGFGCTSKCTREVRSWGDRRGGHSVGNRRLPNDRILAGSVLHALRAHLNRQKPERRAREDLSPGAPPGSSFVLK